LGYVHKVKPSWHSPSHGAGDLCPTKVGDVFLLRFIQRIRIKKEESKPMEDPKHLDREGEQRNCRPIPTSHPLPQNRIKNSVHKIHILGIGL